MNSDHFRLADHYGKNCGKWTVSGRSDKETVYHRLGCKCWDCAHCGPKRAGRYKHVIREAAERHKLTRFVTLTLDPKKLGDGATSGDSVKYLRDSFNKLRTYLRRKYGEAISYICVLEFQQNGMAHLHLLIDRYLEHEWLKRTWSAIGGGTHVDIRRAVGLDRVSRYLAKYLTKELLMSAPKKTRRVTCSRNILLNAKQKTSYVWRVMKQSIFWLYWQFEDIANKVEVDDWQILSSFSVPFIQKTEALNSLCLETR